MSDHGIELYPHNREAYDKLCILLEKYRKACVIHPTGTGKSFIAFKYLEDNPHKKVLWVSPSDTIFYVQIKNLYKATDTVIAAGIEGRIKYMTYPALLKVKNFNRMEKRDVIVLDEFHRCGARKWGKAIEKLMAANKDAVIIGLTATHIRYLDNHRNMAEENPFFVDDLSPPSDPCLALNASALHTIDETMRASPATIIAMLPCFLTA